MTNLTCKQPLIHVGYRKTATTWLQDVFLDNPDLGFASPWGAPSKEALERFVYPNDLDFSSEAVQKAFQAGLEETASKGLIPVLSQEGLIGSHLSDGFQDGRGQQIAERIHSVFPQAKILITIREQASIILSEYRHYIKLGGTATISQFMGIEKNENSGPIYRLENFEYHLPIKHYQELFGAENVLVIPFELLKQDKKLFGRKLLDFFGIENEPNYTQKAKNIGIFGVRLIVQRRFNMIIKRSKGETFIPKLPWLLACKIAADIGQLFPRNINKSIEDSIKQTVDEHIGDLYRQSNQKTSELIGENLKELGYSC